MTIWKPLCVFKKTQFVSVFRSTGASFKKEKRQKVKAVQWPSSAVGVDVILI